METKQVIIVRKDLNMRKGKMVAQGAHASMAAILSQSDNKTILEDVESGIPPQDVRVIPMHDELKHWLNGRFTKICVGCNSEQELFDLANQAEDAEILHFMVRDAGVTEFNGVPTYTAMAIGPAEVSKIDKITKHLKLL